MTLALIILTAAFVMVNVWQIVQIFRDLSAGILGSVADAAAL